MSVHETRKVQMFETQNPMTTLFVELIQKLPVLEINKMVANEEGRHKKTGVTFGDTDINAIAMGLAERFTNTPRFKGFADELSEWEFVSISSHSSDEIYSVGHNYDKTKWNCTCPAFKFRKDRSKHCKHITSLREQESEVVATGEEAISKHIEKANFF